MILRALSLSLFLIFIRTRVERALHFYDHDSVEAYIFRRHLSHFSVPSLSLSLILDPEDANFLTRVCRSAKPLSRYALDSNNFTAMSLFVHMLLISLRNAIDIPSSL